MSFDLSAEEQLIIAAVRELAESTNGRAQWRQCALANYFPGRLCQALMSRVSCIVSYACFDRIGSFQPT
jgi:hypothetical protein